MLEFWFEFGSTYSYPAALRIEDAARASGIAIQWRPFLLGAIFREQGWSDSPFNLHPAKGRYMWRDVERVCDGLGIPFQRPSQFPRNGLLASRLACWFDREAWLPELVRRVYRANFAEDRDISDVPVLASVLGSLGLNAEATLSQAQSPEAKAKLRQQTDRAREAGIFGAPSFLVDGELFWGNDRLEAAIAWCRSSSKH